MRVSGDGGDQGPVFSAYSIGDKASTLQVVAGWGNTDLVLLVSPAMWGLQESETSNAEAYFSYCEVVISNWEL